MDMTQNTLCWKFERLLPPSHHSNNGFLTQRTSTSQNDQLVAGKVTGSPIKFFKMSRPKMCKSHPSRIVTISAKVISYWFFHQFQKRIRWNIANGVRSTPGFWKSEIGWLFLKDLFVPSKWMLNILIILPKKEQPRIFDIFEWLGGWTNNLKHIRQFGNLPANFAAKREHSWNNN